MEPVLVLTGATPTRAISGGCRNEQTWLRAQYCKNLHVDMAMASETRKAVIDDAA
jgi:hypothetical protein